jgi:hypothetical protein
VKPSFSEHGYPHASPPVIEPAQGAPRAIRGKPTIKFVRTKNHDANPPRNKPTEIREAVPHEFHATDQPTHQKLKQ